MGIQLGLLGILRVAYRGYEQQVIFSGIHGCQWKLGLLRITRVLFRGYEQLVICSGNPRF